MSEETAGGSASGPQDGAPAPASGAGSSEAAGPEGAAPSESPRAGDPVGTRVSGADEAEKGPGLVYGLDDIPPPGETLALGFQHYLTMFGSTVAIPLLLAPAFGIDPSTHEGGVDLAKLMATMFFVSGITTLLQTTWGNRLPIVQGGTFSFLGPTFAICGMASLADQGWQVRMQHVQGAIILGSFVEIALGVTRLAGWVLRFVGPVTIAPTIALIGLALFEFGAPIAGTHWPTGGLTIVLIVLFSQVLRRKHRAFELYPILLALLGAWLVAVLCTLLGLFPEGHPAHVSTQNIRNAPWVRIPTPFQWGWPQFGAAAFVGMLAGYLASVVESIGDYFACARLAGAPPPDARTVNRGIAFEGLGCLVAGVFGTGNGTTSYSENIGAIGLTRVGSRRVVQAGALIMLVLGAVGKFGALFTTIPQPIVGGMYCALFGMIAAVGLSNLQLVDLNSSRNLFILGFAFFMGLSVPHYFKKHPLVLVEPAQTAAARPLSDEDPVHPDASGLAVLGLSPKATVGEAKALHARLREVATAAEGADPARADALDAALAAVSAVPPPPPEPHGVLEEFLFTLQNILNTLGKTGMAIAALLALLLDNVVPGTREERGLAHTTKH